MAIALAVTGLPAAVSSAALACSRRVSDTAAGSYSGFGLVPAGACGGTPRSTSTMCRSHHNASAATASGRPSSSVEGGSGGRAGALTTSNPSLISNWARLISVTTPLPAASRTAVPATAITVCSVPASRTRSPTASRPGRRGRLPALTSDHLPVPAVRTSVAGPSRSRVTSATSSWRHIM